MSREEFEENISNREIHTQVENILLDIVYYSAAAIHNLSTLESRLGHFRNWISKGWLKESKTFQDLQIKNPEQYTEIISCLYEGFERGLYKI